MALPQIPHHKGHRAIGAGNSLIRVYIYISIFLKGPPLTEFLDPPLLTPKGQCPKVMHPCKFTKSMLEKAFKRFNNLTSIFTFIKVISCYFLLSVENSQTFQDNSSSGTIQKRSQPSAAKYYRFQFVKECLRVGSTK